MPAGYVLRTSKRVFGIPNFRFYALADGMRQFLCSQTQNPLGAQAEAALERLAAFNSDARRFAERIEPVVSDFCRGLAADDMMHRLRRDLSPLDALRPLRETATRLALRPRRQIAFGS